MDLIAQVKNYKPFNEQEERDKELILSCLQEQKNIYTRENTLVHMTASAWIVNKDRTKALMAYHNIYKSWAWLGGHSDGETDQLKVALKEAKEESGVKNVRPVMNEIFSLEVLNVNGHIKNGKYVSSHLHLNVTYLLEADDTDDLTVKPDENSEVAWFPLEEAMKASSEEWMRENIYKKLVAKLEQL